MTPPSLGPNGASVRLTTGLAELGRLPDGSYLSSCSLPDSLKLYVPRQW
jgi:hypothetical protein